MRKGTLRLAVTEPSPSVVGLRARPRHEQTLSRPCRKCLAGFSGRRLVGLRLLASVGRLILAVGVVDTRRLAVGLSSTDAVILVPQAGLVRGQTGTTPLVTAPILVKGRAGVSVPPSSDI